MLTFPKKKSICPQPQTFANFFLFFISGFFITATIYIVFTSFRTMYSSGLTTLYADQWRIYTDYFSKPFPANIFSLQNGHRPIISGLFFLLDLYLYDANQLSLLSMGGALSLATATCFSWYVLKEHKMTLHFKSAAICTIFITFFWLINARTLLHGNESVHAYLVTFFLMCSIVSLNKSMLTNKRKIQWALFACAFSLLATFSFGAGVAVPPTLLTMAIALHLPSKIKFLFLINVATVVVIYLLFMPSSSEVTGILHSSFPNLTSLKNSLYLLGAPYAYLFSSQLGPHQAASWIKNILCPVAGTTGLLLFLSRIIPVFFEKRSITPLQSTSLAITLFAVISALLIAFMRASYFDAHPGQLFANRYMIWMTMFWGGIFIFELSSAQQKFGTLGQSVLLTACFVSLFVIRHNHVQWYKWADNWNDSVQSAAIGLVAGTHDRETVERKLLRPAEEIFSLADQLKAKHLNIFSLSYSDKINKKLNNLPQSISPTPLFGHIKINNIFWDEPNNSQSASFSGFYTDITRHLKDGYILVSNNSGIIKGLGVLKKRNDKKEVSRNNSAKKILFSGYIKDYTPQANYTYYLAQDFPGTLLLIKDGE